MAAAVRRPQKNTRFLRDYSAMGDCPPARSDLLVPAPTRPRTRCLQCGQTFPSRNKLFNHLYATKHAYNHAPTALLAVLQRAVASAAAGDVRMAGRALNLAVEHVAAQSVGQRHRLRQALQRTTDSGARPLDLLLLLFRHLQPNQTMAEDHALRLFRAQIKVHPPATTAHRRHLPPASPRPCAAILSVPSRSQPAATLRCARSVRCHPRSPPLRR